MKNESCRGKLTRCATKSNGRISYCAEGWTRYSGSSTVKTVTTSFHWKALRLCRVKLPDFRQKLVIIFSLQNFLFKGPIFTWTGGDAVLRYVNRLIGVLWRRTVQIKRDCPGETICYFSGICSKLSNFNKFYFENSASHMLCYCETVSDTSEQKLWKISLWLGCNRFMDARCSQTERFANHKVAPSKITVSQRGSRIRCASDTIHCKQQFDFH